ncbi:hypothetical protein pb186bvf_003027 [Paramecium bursaria]
MNNNYMQFISLKSTENHKDHYPDRVPLLIEISNHSKLTFADGKRQKKYLVSKSDHFYHLLQHLRDSIKLKKSESLYLFLNDIGMVKAAKYKKYMRDIKMKMGSFIQHQQNTKHLDEIIYFVLFFIVFHFCFHVFTIYKKLLSIKQNKNQIRNFIMSLVRPSHQLESHLLEKYDGDQSPLKTIIIASLQTGLAFFVEFLPNTATVYFLGQTENETWISGFGLGFMWGQAFGFGLLQGISCGLETLVSQAYGAKMYDLCGKLYHRALFISTVLLIPISLLMVLSGPILSLINSDTEITDATWAYTRLLMPCIWLNGVFVNTKVFLNGQNIYNYQLYTQCISCLINIGLNYLFISVLDMGLMGCVITRTISELINNIILWNFIYFTKCVELTLIPFRLANLRNSIKFLLTALPIGSIIWIEVMCFEVFTLQASFLDKSEFSANVIMANFLYIAYQFTLGISIAATTFVGNEMGRRNVKQAKKYSISSILVMMAYVISLITGLLIMGRHFGQFFSQNEKIIDHITTVLPFMCIMIFTDGFQGVLSGLVRGVGRAQFAFLSFIVCYLLIGNTVAFTLIHFGGLGLSGVWIGMFTGSAVYDEYQIFNLFWYDWNVLLEDIHKKITDQ